MNFLNIKIELFTKKIQLPKKNSPPLSLKKLEEKIEKKHAKILKFSKFKKREKRAYFASILTWSIN